MSTVADTIKSTLSMRDVAEAYGFHPNRGGYIACPFHNEKTASLKIYTEPGRGFHCFGCGQGGTVIDFVMRLLDIKFAAAVVRLNADFRLGLTDDKPDPREVARLRRERREAEQKRAAFEAEYKAQTERFRRLWAAKMAGYDHPDYAEACRELDGLEYYFETHPFTVR